MILRWIVFGIILCLLNLTLLLMMDTTEELPAKNYHLGLAKTYTFKDNSVDLFEKWQKQQSNELEQRKWDAYMENDS